MSVIQHTSFQIVIGMALWCLVPFLGVAISIVYYCASPTAQKFGLRLLASSHGVSISILYVGLFMFLWFMSAHAVPAFELPFLLLSLVPLALIVVSFFIYRGSKHVHFLQVPNIMCLLWTHFIGNMAVTGIWL